MLFPPQRHGIPPFYYFAHFLYLYRRIYAYAISADATARCRRLSETRVLAALSGITHAMYMPTFDAPYGDDDIESFTLV